MLAIFTDQMTKINAYLNGLDDTNHRIIKALESMKIGLPMKRPNQFLNQASH
tara:strand:+ start:381 stop:536 length:156 start_codon:yes stop_codon:yes gene_type:complete